MAPGRQLQLRLLLLALGACWPAVARFVLPVNAVAPKLHTRRPGCVAFGGNTSGAAPAYETLADAVAGATDPATGIVTFLSGNRAMNAMALNFAASVGCLPRPFPFMMVPLDAEGRDEMNSVGLVPVFHDREGEARFASPEALDGCVLRLPRAV
jgi:hypothetical protein